MGIREDIKKSFVCLDGGMGTLLQTLGLRAGELPERRNITNPEDIIGIHKAYFDAGSNVVNTNTFGANSLKFSDSELEEIICAAVKNAKEARRLSSSKKNMYVALDIGPLGKLLAPYGDFEFEEAISVFAKSIRLGVKYGVDLIMIETMNDSYETKAALLAAKENSDLPVFVSNAYGEDGKLMTGASPSAMVAMLEGMGADAVGANCSLGPKQLMGVVRELVSAASVPVLVKPNAGLPCNDGEHTYYDVNDDEFSESIAEMARLGANILGGCCGTTPEYIKKTVKQLENIAFKPIEKKNKTVISSYTHSVEIGKRPILIGERINPTGKKRFKQALMENDIGYILGEGIGQKEHGAHVLDVNVGLPNIDEPDMLERVVRELQAVINLPLQIDTSSAVAMERALRIYNGKAMINSVNGKKESMETVFPLVKKYGGTVVALTLDEDGIPSNAEGRIKIAEKILNVAEKYGIDRKDIVFDTLCMSVSADTSAPSAALDSLDYIRNKMGVNTVLGVSNISFGLPLRDVVNSAFFAFALERGLSSAIINPFSTEMMKTYHTYNLLHKNDENCTEYIEFAESIAEEENVKNSVKPVRKSDGEENGDMSDLFRSIVKGLKEQARSISRELLKDNDALDVVNREIVPALDFVGKGFEEKRFYLPQLLMSADAAKFAFEEVKEKIVSSGEKQIKKDKIVIATVHGDIHDIGKNIVKVLLENYGFQVIDLGKDVPPEKIAEAVVQNNAPMCGLSALMTTTVPAMEETIRQVKKVAPTCKVIVGGAVLNQEYADRIGADKYSKDAMETVRYAENLNKNRAVK